MAAKVKLIFDVFPEEKAEFERLCKSLGMTKVEFLRQSIAGKKKVLEEEG